MLKGEEPDWSPLSQRSIATYSNLSPGEYTFLVRSCNGGGHCNESPQQVHLIILAPFWQKSWFLWAMIGAGSLVLFLIFYFRIQTVRRSAQRKNMRLELEKSVVELEQKALRLQMNPHFIFNTLNSIQGLIATKDTKTARLYLSKFSKLMRETLENSRESLISVEEEVSSLSHYLDLEKFSHGDTFEYNINVSEGAEIFMIPPLLVQPFAENAIIHGLLPKNGGGLLDIRFREEGGSLVIEIEDNGVGRISAAANNAQKSSYHKSTGLQVTQERLDLINNNGAGGIEIIDLMKGEKPLGTLVRLKVQSPES
jgi:sensor histidine kinase YesM